MQVVTKPLNQELRRRLQSWLGQSEYKTFRDLIRAKIIQEKSEALRLLVSSIEGGDADMEAAQAHAAEVVRYEWLLVLIESIRVGHKPDSPDQKFEYAVVDLITDHEPLIEESNV